MLQSNWAHVPRLALQLLSPHATTAEAHAHPRAPAPQEKSLQREASTPQLESSLCLTQLEKSLWGNQDQAQPKINK